MPNWNFNEVTIHAPIEAVKKRLYVSRKECNKYGFNMHLLFPATFYKRKDPSWNELRDYYWAWENTGSKWFPNEVTFSPSSKKNITYISFDTAWSPNNLTLLRLSEATGWKIENEYEEWGIGFEWTFIAENWEIVLDEEREYRPICEKCENKFDYELESEDEESLYLCPNCRGA